MNGQLRARLSDTATGGRVHWADCDYDALFLTADRMHLRADRLPDGLHPNAAAWDALAVCLDGALAPLLAGG